MKPAPLAPELVFATNGRHLATGPGTYSCAPETGKPAIEPWLRAEWDAWLDAMRGLRLDDFPATTLVANRPYRMRRNFHYADPTPGAPVCSYREPWEPDHQMVMLGKWRPPMRNRTWLKTRIGREQLKTWYWLSLPMFIMRSLCQSGTGPHTKVEVMFLVYRRFSQGQAPPLKLLQDAYALRHLMRVFPKHPIYWTRATGRLALQNAVSACGVTRETGPRGVMTRVGNSLYRASVAVQKELDDSSVLAATVGLLGIPMQAWSPDLAEVLPARWRSDRKKYGERERLAGLFAIYRSVPADAVTNLNQRLVDEIRGLSHRVMLNAYGRGVHRILKKHAAWSALFRRLELVRQILDETLAPRQTHLRLRDP